MSVDAFLSAMHVYVFRELYGISFYLYCNRGATPKGPGTPTKGPNTPTKSTSVPSSPASSHPPRAAPSTIDNERYDEAIYPFLYIIV